LPINSVSFPLRKEKLTAKCCRAQYAA
jgi:hypothetical protein